MRILFLGTYVPDQFADQIPTISAAGNQFQYNLTAALKKNHEVHSLSYIAVPTDGNLKTYAEQCCGGRISFFLPKVDGFWNAIRDFREALCQELKWADCVVAYNALYPWFSIRGKMQKVLILADYTPPKEESGLRRKVMSALTRISFAKYDYYVLLSEESKRYVRKGKNVIVLNGAIQWSNFQKIQKPDERGGQITFLYSGVLNRVTGLDLLLNAFRMTKNPDYRLIICGQGTELLTEIENSCREDSRITYKGYVCKKEYYRLLEQALVVVNPRNMSMQQNRYNFPSKVLEYIASGRVVLSTKFVGYDNYEKYLLFAESDAEDLCRMMDVAAKEANEQGEAVYIRNRDFAQKLDWSNVAERFVGASGFWNEKSHFD